MTDVEALRARGTDLKLLGERGVEIFFTQVFNHSFFHADMHPGNIFVDATDPADPTYIAVDCAIVGSLSEADQYYLGRNLLGIFRRDYREVAQLHVECGWVPHVKEQMDIRYRIRNPKEMAPIRLLPSEYFDRNMSFVFITDPYGIENRHRVGVERMLWSSDYPHTSTEWPESWKAIERDFVGVPEDEKQLILAGNAARLYGFAGVRERAGART